MTFAQRAMSDRETGNAGVRASTLTASHFIAAVILLACIEICSPCIDEKKAGTSPPLRMRSNYLAGGGVSGLLSFTDAGSSVFLFATALFTFVLVFFAAFFVFTSALCAFWTT
jgi:hypothetical protein